MLALDFCSTAHLETDVVVPVLFLKGKSLARSRIPKLHPSNLEPWIYPLPVSK
jgi:hypothetical protein